MPGTGPSRSPRKIVRKKLQTTYQVTLNNNTSEYSYYSKYMRPDVESCIGSAVQFAAYELFRIRSVKVSIQMAQNSDALGASSNPAFNYATSAVVWTAADFGANENVSGVSIMQYQNAKKNTCSLNKWTPIVNTGVRYNFTPNTTAGTNVILPGNTWLNTANPSSAKNYSGYQLFIQNFGSQNLSIGYQPSFTIIEDYDCEFLQPAFQNNASNFSTLAFGMKMWVIPDPNSDETRQYNFNRITVDRNGITGEREMTIRLTRADGLPGSLTFTNMELRECIASGRSGTYFGDRRITYDGPFPPRDIPEQDYDLGISAATVLG